MNKGFWAGDSIASGLEIAGMNIRRAAEDRRTVEVLEELRAKNKRLIAVKEEMIDANAGNLAEKHALRTALAKYEPNHPLLSNEVLREKLHIAATRVYYINHNWDDVWRYGQKFEY